MHANRFSRAGTRRMAALFLVLAMTLALLCALRPLSSAAAPEKVTQETLADVIKNKSFFSMTLYGTVFEPLGEHFQMTVEVNKSVFDATAGIGTAANDWYFDIYYRPTGSGEEYDKVSCDLQSPGCLYDWQDGRVIYRLYLEKTPFQRLQMTGYDLTVVVRQGEAIKGYNDKLSFTWTEQLDGWYSDYYKDWPDRVMVKFSVPMYDTPFTYPVNEGESPIFDGETFRPGYEFLGWEAGGVLYEGALPPATEDVSYTAVYRADYLGDVNGDGALSAKDLSRILQALEKSSIKLPASASMLDGKEGLAVSDATAALSLLARGELFLYSETIAALRGKTALFLGDSITEATTTDSLHPCWSWAGRVANYYGMKSYKNAGKSGASISTIRGSNRVLAQLNSNKNGDYDFVILHGSTNDAWDNAKVGEMTAADCFELSQFDPNTFAGGLEELFFYAKQYYPDAKIGYIVNFRFNPNLAAGSLNDMTEYIEVSKKICDKWGIPYIDLSTDEIYEKLQPGNAKNFADTNIHPNSYGYDILYPYVADAMAKM